MSYSLIVLCITYAPNAGGTRVQTALDLHTLRDQANRLYARRVAADMASKGVF
jgi:hypothetical protein